jgi:hypothetical protein
MNRKRHRKALTRPKCRTIRRRLLEVGLNRERFAVRDTATRTERWHHASPRRDRSATATRSLPKRCPCMRSRIHNRRPARVGIFASRAVPRKQSGRIAAYDRRSRRQRQCPAAARPALAARDDERHVRKRSPARRKTARRRQRALTKQAFASGFLSADSLRSHLWRRRDESRLRYICRFELGLFEIWRRRRDSNPRYALRAYNGLANRRLQPLGHVSVFRAMPERLLLCKKAAFGPHLRASPRATIRARKFRTKRRFAGYPTKKGNSGSPGVGLFSCPTRSRPITRLAMLPIALCVEFAVKYEAAVTLRARPSPRP